MFSNNKTYAIYNLTVENLNTSEKYSKTIVITSLKIDFQTVYYEKYIKLIWRASIAFYPPNIDLENKIDKNLLFTLEKDNKIILETKNNGDIGILTLPYGKALNILGKEKYLTANIRWRSLFSIETIKQNISIVKFTLWLKWIKFSPLSFKAYTVNLPSLKESKIEIKKFYIYVNNSLLRDIYVKRIKQYYLVDTNISISPTSSIIILPVPETTYKKILLPEVTKT